MRRRLVQLGACLGAALALVAGCAPAPRPVRSVTTAHASPGLHAPAIGVELAWWVVDDNPFDDRLATGEAPRTIDNARPIAEVFAPYLNRVVPVPREMRERWKANGFRLVSVPRAELEAVREALRLAGPVQQQWVGESPRWMQAMQGPRWGSPQPARLDDGAVTLSPGSLRLLLRCWSGPALGSASVDTSKLPVGSIPGAVHIEVVPQHSTPFDRGDIAALLKPRPSLHDEGALFTRLSLEASFANDEALLIIPDRPDAEWKIKPDPAPEFGDEMFSQVGPPLPSTPTLGELMMTDLVTGGRRNSRVVLVVLPMPPSTFNLLARQ
jgi:hypothetical protein